MQIRSRHFSIGQISIDDSVEFQNEWNALKKNKDKIYIYLTILPIRIVRLEILNLLNTVMLRTIRDCQFLIQNILQ